MSDYDVGVGLSVEGGNTYQTNMSQAIALTEQYTKVADGMAGSMADLSAGMVGLTGKMTGFTKVQSVALDTAAGYQKMMEKIEATTKITGGDFNTLQKVTKGFARDFPVGMGKAVQVMQDMQAVGLKNEKQLEKLGKSFIKFEGVTGGSAKEFMQLNKTMGNGVDQFEKLSDSLVTVTSKMGGSAPAVVAFSKALAPVASTVGLSQTQVMGLSTAMSTLGEDGYRAANTFNKVLLDMNRSVRDGGPGLKAYADLMGTTSENLTSLLKNNPAEFLSKFTEAVGKGGVNTSRMMETLGFDTVRDTRSIQALANAGGPRKAIEEAVSAYGDGSTSKSAEVMFDGLTDSVIELKETMSQTVVNIAQPMLNVAKGQVEIMKGVAGVAENITGSDIGQGVAKTVGYGSMVGNFAMGGANALAMIAMAKIAKDKIADSKGFTDLRRGMVLGAAGRQVPDSSGKLAHVGQAIGGAGYDPSRPPVRPLDTLKAGAKQTLAIGKDVAGRALLAGLGNPYRQAAGLDPIHSKSGDEHRARVSELKQQEADRQAVKKGLPTSPGYVPGAGPATRGEYIGARTSSFFRQFRDAGGPDGQSMTKALRGTAAGALAMGDQGLMTAKRGILGVGGALGMSPMMMGLMAAGGVGYMAYSSNKKGEAAREGGFGSKSDIYGTFNGFMESIGMAGRGLKDFSIESANATETLTKQNTTMASATQLTEDEMANAASSSYQSKFKLQGDDRSDEGIAAQVTNAMGTSTDTFALARIMGDVANQTDGSTANRVGKMVLGQLGDNGRLAPDIDGSLQNLVANTDTGGIQGNMNEAQMEIAKDMGRAIMQGIEADSAPFTGTVKAGGETISAKDVAAMKAFEDTWETSRKALGFSSENSAAAQAVAGQLAVIGGVSKEDAEKTGLSLGGTTQPIQQYTAENFIKQAIGTDEGKDVQFYREYMAAKEAGLLEDNVSMRQFAGGTPENEKAASTSEGIFRGFFKGAGLLDKGAQSLIGVMSKASEAGREQGKFITDPTLDKSGFSKQELAYDAYANESSNAAKLSKAADGLLELANEGTGGNTAQGMRNLQVGQAQFTENSTEWNVFAKALEKATPQAQLSQAGKSQNAILIEQIQAGRAAANIPTSPTNYAMNSLNTSTVNIGTGAQANAVSQMQGRFAAMGALQQQTGAIQRQSGIQAGSIARDAALKEQWATEDYETNKGYQKEDYRTSKRRANRDYNRSVGRATRDFGRSQEYQQEDYITGVGRMVEDYEKQKTRMEEDYQRQRKNSTEDFETSRVRATRDYNKQVERANRDFQLQEGRAQEDFQKGQTRAGEDYNKNRTRMMQDYAKSMKRMTEDAAKQMYDPFKRMQVEMVMDAGQLVANLDEQAAAVEKQKKTLDKLRELGMTDDTIKALNLADASKAQQASRLLGDAEGNGALVGKMNDSVSRKNTAAGALVQDSGNVQTSRMAEDFAQQLARGEEDYNTSAARAQEDFATSQARSKEDFKTSMADTKADFDTSMADSLADFNLQMARGSEEYAIAVGRGVEDLRLNLARMEEDNNKSKARAAEAFNTSMMDMAEDHRIQMQDAFEEYLKAQKRQEEAFEKSIERMRISAANAISDVGANAAASIASMNEQMVGLFQDIPDMSTTEGQIAAAETLFGKMLGLGIDPALWGTELKTFFALIEATTGVEIAGLHPTQETAFDGILSGIPEEHEVTQRVNKAMGMKGNEGAVKILEDLAKNSPTDKSTMAGIMAASYGSMTEQVPAPSAVANEVNKAMGINGEPGAVKALEKLAGESTTDKTTLAGIMKASYGAMTEQTPTPASVLDKVSKTMGLDDTTAATAIGSLKILAGESTTNTSTMAGIMKASYGPMLSQIPPRDSLTAAVLLSVGTTADAFGKSMMGTIFNLANPQYAESIPAITNGMYTGLYSNIPDKDTMDSKFTGFVEGTGLAVERWLSLWRDKKIQIKDNEDVLLGTVQGSASSPAPGWRDWYSGGVRAQGGIDFKPTLAWIAEAGYPEATIPLNQRGADVLAATMSRYLDNSEVRGSQAQQYSSPVINNNDVTYDYRTQFTGAVTVQAQDPDQMAQKLAAKRRRQRLAQPIGGKR